MTVPSTQRALVLAPHPDDESIGCGGTIKVITSAGGIVDVLYMTRGEHGHFPGVLHTQAECDALAARREAEARKACGILGVRDIVFLGGADGQILHQPQLASTIRQRLADFDYRSVFCTWPEESHNDHRATYLWLHHALAALASAGRALDVWFYEVWTPMSPNMHITIDSTLEAKMQALESHQSQMDIFNYADGFRGLAAYRGLACPPARFAEAFFVCNSRALLKHDGIPWPRPTELAALPEAS